MENGLSSAPGCTRIVLRVWESSNYLHHHMHTEMQPAHRRPQSLILSPTRELAGQTTKTIQAMGEFMKVRAHTCVGGTSLGKPASLRLPCYPLALLVL